MSILLEALRKSEKSQRPLESPTIHTDQQAVATARSGRKGLLLSLLLIAVLLIAWFAWREYQQPAEGYQPPVTLPPRTEGVTGAPAAPVNLPEPGTNVVEKVSKGTVKVASDATKAQRTPVEAYQQADSTPQKTNTVKPKAVKPKATASKPKPQAADAIASNAGEQAVKTPTDAIPIADKTPAPISYWDLPDAVRAEIPVMNFSVLVYAQEPANRFVLANGQRLVEGDSIQQGLVVEEIRRDGVVFSYRLYRFLVDR